VTVAEIMYRRRKRQHLHQRGRTAAPRERELMKMQHNPGNVALLPRPARHTPFAPFVPEGVTVCMTSAVLAPAPAVPAAAETPVFVDDSGARKRLLRITGVLLGLLAIGFLGVVGIAIATPSVATSVGLGDVTPFVVPGAAAPPPAKAPTAPVQAAKPKPKPKARPAQVTAPEPAAPAPQPAPSHAEPIADPTDHDDKPHHAKHNDQTGDHGKHSDHGQTNPPSKSGQTDDHGQQSNPAGQSGDQTSQNQQDAEQAPVQADTPAVDANAAAQ
jgi:hypothetical protein